MDGLSDEEMLAGLTKVAQPAGPVALSDEEMAKILSTQGAKPRPVSTAEDMAKSGASGVVKGGIGLVALPHTVATLGYNGAQWLAKKMGVEGPDVGDTFDSLPSYQGTKEKVEEVTGKLYEPKTVPGEYAQTVGEFVPNALAPGGLVTRVVNVIAPAVVSETAGQLTKNTAIEPAARIAGGMVGGIAATRAATPFPISPERAALTRTLENEGVNITAGDRTGRLGLRYMESAANDVPFGGHGIGAAKEMQAERFTRAILRRVGENAPRATPEVLDRAFTRIGGQFDNLAARNTLSVDPRFVNDVVTARNQYNQMVAPSARAPIVENMVRDIYDRLAAGGGDMPGAVYQAWRSRLDKAARSSGGDPQLQESLFSIRNALDDAMGRSISPADQQAWAQARRQYRNMIVVEKAATAAGENAAQGLISPSQLRNAVVAQNRRAYARGDGDFGELARAGEGILKPLPQSGTAPRLAAQHTLTAIGALGAGAPGAAIGAVATPLGARALMSGPVQAYLGNQVAQNVRRAPIWAQAPEMAVNVNEGGETMEQRLARLLASHP